MKNISVKNSGIEGKGVFAEEPIKKEESICIMKGTEVSLEEMKGLYEKGEERNGDPLQVSKHKYVDLDPPYVFINHSCSPNAGIRGKNRLVAIKKISGGEEITFDYSTTMADDLKEIKRVFGKNATHWTMKCGCGSAECRHTIRQFIELPKKKKKEYLVEGVVPRHVLQSIQMFK